MGARNQSCAMKTQYPNHLSEPLAKIIRRWTTEIQWQAILEQVEALTRKPEHACGYYALESVGKCLAEIVRRRVSLETMRQIANDAEALLASKRAADDGLKCFTRRAAMYIDFASRWGIAAFDGVEKERIRGWRIVCGQKRAKLKKLRRQKGGEL